ncbi:hypothetical protein HRbin39_01202 [bacterium HR39]|nr:hypothetical protein HRbin39_01202 [bacterium HR39]
MDARIQHHDTVGIGQHRVEVDLLHQVLVDDQAGEAQEGADQRTQVHARPVAPALQQSPDARAADGGEGEFAVERRQGDGGIAQRLDRDAAGTEHQHRPEQRIGARSEQQLVGVGHAHHLLYHEALDAGFRLEAAHVRQHARGGAPHLRLALEAELDAAHVRLVEDVGREDLEGDGQPHEPGGTGRLLRIGRPHRAGHGQTVGFQHLARLGRVHPGAALGQRPLQHPTRPLGLAALVGVGGGGDAQQRLLVAPVPQQIGEAAYRLAGGCEGRDPALGEGAPGRLHRRPAHPGGEQPVRAGARHVHHRAGAGLRIAAGRGSVEHQHRVRRRIRQHRFERRAVAPVVRIADDVDGVGAAPGGRQDGVEPLQRPGRERRELAARLGEGVRRQHPEPAGVGDDGEAASGDARARTQGGRGGEELGEIEDLQQAGPLEGRRVDLRLAGQRSRVRARRPRALGRAATLDHDDRPRAGQGAGGGHELAHVGEPLDVEEHGAGLRIEGEPLQHVPEVDVGHVAEADGERQADAAAARPVHHRGDHAAGLGDEGEPAGRRRDVEEADIQLRVGCGKADGVGADDAQQVRAGRFEHPLLQLAPLGSRLGEAGGEHEHRARAAPSQGLDQLRHGGCGRGDHRKVGCHRQGVHRGIGQHAVHRHGPRIDRQHRTREAGPHQVADDDVADLGGIAARPDHRHRGRPEQRVEVADAHPRHSPLWPPSMYAAVQHAPSPRDGMPALRGADAALALPSGAALAAVAAFRRHERGGGPWPITASP